MSNGSVFHLDPRLGGAMVYPRLEVILLLDLSSDMAGEKLDWLARYIPELIQHFILRYGAQYGDLPVSLCLGAITYGDGARWNTEPTSSHELPSVWESGLGSSYLTADGLPFWYEHLHFSAAGSSSLGAALDLLHVHFVDAGKRLRLAPLVVLVSGTVPAEDWQSSLNNLISTPVGARARRFAVLFDGPAASVAHVFVTPIVVGERLIGFLPPSNPLIGAESMLDHIWELTEERLQEEWDLDEFWDTNRQFFVEGVDIWLSWDAKRRGWVEALDDEVADVVFEIEPSPVETDRPYQIGQPVPANDVAAASASTSDVRVVTLEARCRKGTPIGIRCVIGGDGSWTATWAHPAANDNRVQTPAWFAGRHIVGEWVADGDDLTAQWTASIDVHQRLRVAPTFFCPICSCTAFAACDRCHKFTCCPPQGDTPATCAWCGAPDEDVRRVSFLS